MEEGLTVRLGVGGEEGVDRVCCHFVVELV